MEKVAATENSVVKLKAFGLDSAVMKQAVYGWELRFKRHIPNGFLAPGPYDHYITEFSLFREAGLGAGQDPQKADKPVYSTEDLKSIYPGSIETRFFIPEADLYHLLPGSQMLTAVLSGRFASVRFDTLEGKNIVLKRKETDSQYVLRFRIRVPKLYEGKLIVSGFELDTTQFDPSTYDFRLLGPGYPDVFWSLRKGGENLFESGFVRNLLQYTATDTSPVFHFSKRDSIEILVSDHDEISRSDLVGLWRGSPFELRSPNPFMEIQMPRVKWFRLRMEMD